ncbi:MAG: insulinase family protein [Candidatus Eremiobacteraeota bacterium]|nr:insulinase family protein [Candidatus Eremiobacteraeota bacterium]
MKRLAVHIACALLVFSGSPGKAARAADDITVTNATLSNGLRVVVVRDTLAPVVSTFLNFEAGSDDEPITGLAHAQEHMVYRDTSTLSGAQADEIAGFMGDYDNADTQNVITQYFHLVPSEDLSLALQLDRARFTGALDSQANWNIERGAIEQEVTRDNSDASFRIYVKMLHHLMAGTVYADEGLGTLQSFGKQINAPQLKRFFHTWYHPNNAVYVIAGNVDPQAAIGQVRKFFGYMKKAAVPAHRSGRLAPLTAATYSDTSDKSTTVANVGYRFPGYQSSDYAASVILADALNNQRGALLDLVAKGKAIDAQAQTSVFPQAAVLFISSDVAIGTDPHSAVRDLQQVVDAYRRTGIPADLVTAAKAHEVASFELASSSVDGLAQAWSQGIAVEHRTPDQDLAAVQRVTPADVNRVLRMWLRNDTAVISYAVPKNGGATSAGSNASGETNAKPEQTQVEPLPTWATAALQHLRVPDRTIAPAVFSLDNGLHIVVQPEHASKTVVVEGTVLHDAGLQEPTGQSGVGTVLEKVLPYGTTSLDRITYNQELDALAATVTAGYNFSLSVPSMNVDRGLQLLADDELHPALRAEDLSVVKDQVAADLTGDAGNPDHLSTVAEMNALYPVGDPARRFPSADDVKKLSVDNVRAFFKAAYRPDLTTIVIVGDIAPEAARRSVQRWFGSWRASGRTPNVFPSPAPPNVTSDQVVPATGRIQDTVRLTETMPLTVSDSAVAPLNIANTVLSGDFSSMLIRDLRVTTGYVYYVGSTLQAGKTRSTFAVEYGSSPENVNRARALAMADLRRMQTQTVESERFLRAKARLLSVIPIREESYDGLAKQLLQYASQGLPLDEDVRLGAQELAATPDDVRAAMAKYVRPQDFVTIVEGPAPR